MPVSEGARRRWCVSTGEGRDKITPIDRVGDARGCRLRQAQKLSPEFIGQHCNFLGCQPAQIRRSSTPTVLIKDANVVSLAPE